MLRGLLTTTARWLQDWSRSLQPDRVPAPEMFLPAAPRTYRPLRRVVLAEEVSRTLFRDFAEHRRSPRGEEEVGWVLLGLREESDVVVLATLPAGADRQAGVAHVRFNSGAQSLASRIVRQRDRRLVMVGVVHTHPGSLRHPSDGDFQGDSLWVGQLRGGEGVFGIGTADVEPANGQTFARPEHVQVDGELCFSWYALGAGDKRYRRLPVETAQGPDLARPLHPIWDTLELHADALDGLCRQLAQISFEVVEGKPALVARVPVVTTGESLRVVLRQEEVRFYLDRGGELISIDPQEAPLDRAVLLILAELIRRRGESEARPELLGKA
jgi:proteasome lid subunit RPN8/RPN11